MIAVKNRSIQNAFANCSDILYDAASRGEIPAGQFEVIEAALWNAYKKIKWNGWEDYGKKWDWGGGKEKEPYIEPYAEKKYQELEKLWDKIQPEPEQKKPVVEKKQKRKQRRKKKKSRPRQKLTIILPRRIHWR